MSLELFLITLLASLGAMLLVLGLIVYGMIKAQNWYHSMTSKQYAEWIKHRDDLKQTRRDE